MPTDDSRSNGHPVSFSNFEVDLRARELRKHGTKIKLQDQPFQILALLLEKPGEVVTREEIRNRLWPADTFVDFDHSLNSAVKKLRQALSDDPDVPRFIETLPRRGYRFIAPLRNGSAPAAAAPPEIAPVSDPVSAQSAAALPPPPASRPHRWKLFAAAVGFFVLAVALIAWLRSSSPLRTTKVAASAPVRLVPLTSFSSNLSKASFSPDGSQVAFQWDGDQPNHALDIYIKQIGTEKPLQITDLPGYSYFPAWSPDGHYIAFFHENQDQSPVIFVIPALGGPARQLHGLARRLACHQELNWSPDGKFLLFSEQSAANQPCRIVQLTIEDLTVRQLSDPPVPSTGDWGARYSPNGKSIAFIRNSKDVEDIYVMPAAGGTPRRVTFDNRFVMGLAWTPDSREIVFSSDRGGANGGLWRIFASGGTPERLSVGSDNAYMPDVSLKGNRLLYASGAWNENIWHFPVGPGHRIGKPDRIISSAAQEEGPQYSPDGKYIVFQSTRTGDFQIWRADADGSNLVQLTSFTGPLTGTPRWSPDGRQIAFDSRPGPHPNIYVVTAEGGPSRRFPNDTSDDAVPSWSHDGRTIYFASNRTGAWQVWKRTVDGGKPVQVTSNGGFAAFESPDGKSIYYAKFNEKGIWQAPVNGGQEAEVVDEPPADYWGYFGVGHDGLYYVGDTGTAAKHQPGFKFFDFATRKITNMGDIEKVPGEAAPGFSVSPDGKNILFVQLDDSRISLMLAENFR